MPGALAADLQPVLAQACEVHSRAVYVLTFQEACLAVDRQHLPWPPELADAAWAGTATAAPGDSEALWRERWRSIMQSLHLSAVQQVLSEAALSWPHCVTHWRVARGHPRHQGDTHMRGCQDAHCVDQLRHKLLQHIVAGMAPQHNIAAPLP